MSTLAKEYFISDNGLRKICKKFDIPLPLLGHWQKMQYNKKVNVIPLPKDFKGEDSIQLNERKEGDGKENEGISQFHRLLKEISADTSLSFKVPDKLSNPEKEFNDTNNLTLEEQIPKILTKLELVSEKIKKKNEEIENWYREWRKKKEAEEVIKKRHANEVENFKKLLEDSERWKKAADLRNFIKELESNAIKKNKLSEELANWIKWSNDKADWFDPLVNKTDDLLTEKDKQEIISPKKPHNNYYGY